MGKSTAGSSFLIVGMSSSLVRGFKGKFSLG